MGLKWTDEPKQPGETLYYSMEYEPGVAIAVGDTLTGTPTVGVKTYPGGTDMSSTMVVPGSVVLNGNIVSVGIKAGTDGMDYKITFKANTTLGEQNVEADLGLQVREI